MGPWVVLLLPLSNGSYSCTALTRSPPVGPPGYSMAFALSPSATHFYLNYNAATNPAPSEVTLAVDGESIGRLKVLLDEPLDGGSQQLLMADIPGDMLARQLIPAMVIGRMLDVIVGERHFTMTIAMFGSIVRDLRECAQIRLGSRRRFIPMAGRSALMPGGSMGWTSANGRCRSGSWSRGDGNP